MKAIDIIELAVTLAVLWSLHQFGGVSLDWFTLFGVVWIIFGQSKRDRERRTTG